MVWKRQENCATANLRERYNIEDLTMFMMMVLTYLVVAVAQFAKIRRIPMDEALKNVE